MKLPKRVRIEIIETYSHPLRCDGEHPQGEITYIKLEKGEHMMGWLDQARRPDKSVETEKGVVVPEHHYKIY